jgi:hypothetical protein
MLRNPVQVPGFGFRETLHIPAARYAGQSELIPLPIKTMALIVQWVVLDPHFWAPPTFVRPSHRRLDDHAMPSFQSLSAERHARVDGSCSPLFAK